MVNLVEWHVPIPALVLCEWWSVWLRIVALALLVEMTLLIGSLFVFFFN